MSDLFISALNSASVLVDYILNRDDVLNLLENSVEELKKAKKTIDRDSIMHAFGTYISDRLKANSGSSVFHDDYKGCSEGLKRLVTGLKVFMQLEKIIEDVSEGAIALMTGNPSSNCAYV